MNLEHVATYLAVLRTGSFHAAARERGLSQASVSQHVRALEVQQGAALVVRDRAGCHAVRGTEEFARYAALLVSLAERASRGLVRPSLTVGASSNIGTYLIHPVFKSFVDQRADDLEARLVIGTNGDVAEQLTSGGIDVALMEWWDDRPGFEAVGWREEEVVVIAGPEHPWRTRRTVTPGELAGEIILGGEPQTGTGTLLRERLGAAAGDLRVGMSLGNTEAVKRAVRHGLGVSLVLAGAVADEVSAGQLHVLRIEGAKLRKTLWAVSRRDEPPTSPSHRFVDYLRSSES
ncbi:MAG: LysR family transcriptional regulator [Streptosporangiales bacterium]|nr:LysR family transcriptional regulator [Streptosporangiales bacterium]